MSKNQNNADSQPPPPWLARIRRLLQAFKFFTKNPGLARCAFQNWSSGRPVVVIYSVLHQHRHALQNVIEALHEHNDGKWRLVVVNGFHEPNHNSSGARDGPDEWGGLPVSMLRFFSCQLVLTAASGFEKDMVSPDAIVVHFLHSLGSLDGLYLEHHFDYFDYIVCAGEHHVDSFKKWRADRENLAGKVLIRGGYPKLDASLADPLFGSEPDPRTVVYAPTLTLPENEELSSLRRYGEGIIRTLLEMKLRVIFRPHPCSFDTDDAPFIDAIIKSFCDNPNFELDRQKSYAQAYSRSSLMITDLSGTGFSYAFTLGRPVIFFAANETAETDKRGIQYQCRDQIGQVARDFAGLARSVNDLRVNAAAIQNKIKAFRAQSIFNLGHSAEYITQRLNVVLKRGVCEDWVRL